MPVAPSARSTSRTSAPQEEKLDGENRYFCENCQGKQSATRRIKLNSLPPTLNLQLMRFIFDRYISECEEVLSRVSRVLLLYHVVIIASSIV